MGSFKFNHNRVAKVVEVVLEGVFNETDCTEYVNEYSKLVNSIDATSYSIDLDCIKLGLSSPSMAAMLEDCFKLYNADGFNAIKFRIEANNILLKMQLNRLAKKVGLKNFEIIM